MIQIGNGNWAVKEDNLLGFRYDETEGVYFPREMTFGRACDATRVNPDGLIERVPYNLVQYSNTFSNGAWTKLNVTQASGQIGYDGSSNAWLTSFTAGSTRAFGPNIAQTGVVTYSIFAKAGTHNFIQLTSSTSSSIYVNYNISATNASVGNKGAGVVGASIESIGNDWYRCSITFDNTASSTMWLWIVNSNTSARASAVSTDGNFLVQAAQAVEGTTAKPYFPTTNRQDIARIDYSSGTGALLLEPQRTNLVTYSEKFDNAAWSKLNAAGGSAPVVTANYGLAPDNTMSADRVQLARTTQTFSYSELKQNFGTTGTQYTVSVYLKSLSGTPTISFARDGSSFNYLATLTNDWVRYTATFTASGTPSAELILYQQVSATSLSADFLVWGFQAEASSYPTSYIPTTSATVTRLADSCYKTGVADWIGQTEGVLFGEFYVPQIITAGSYVRTIINDGTSLNQIAFFYYPDGRIQATSSVGGSIVVSFNIPLFGLTAGTHKFAFGYKLNDYVLFVDGVNVGIDTSATVPSMSVLNLYDTSGGSMYYKHATIYKTRLSNSELAALTTI